MSDPYRAEVAQIAAAAPSTAPDYHSTDVGNGRRFVADHGDAVIYNHTAKRWYVWSGTHWQADTDGTVDRLAKATVAGMYQEAARITDDTERPKLVKHALRSESDQRIRAMLSMARTELEIARDESAFIGSPLILNVQNGALELRTGQLLPHKRADLLTYCLDVAYNPEAVCPTWRRFVSEVFDDDDDLIDYVQRAVGYTITGSTVEQVLFVLYGAGANGKTTFVEPLMRLLGPLAQAARFESFLTRSGDQIPNDIARMRGARLVTAMEAGEGRRFSEALLKQLTGGDTVTARFMRGEWFDFKPKFKLWLAANHRPRVTDTSEAFWRRVRLIPFNVTFTPNQRDRELGRRLGQELPGILAWAVQGCRNYFAGGLGNCAAVEQHTQEYRDAEDVLSEFVHTRCNLDAEETISKKDLYARYKTWADENGEKALTQSAFSRRLRESCPAVDSKRQAGGVHVWIGIGKAQLPPRE